MAAVVHNYAARITRHLKKPDDRGNDYVADSIVNDIAFIEGNHYEVKIADLVKELRETALPKDIILELAHNWTGSIPSGSPLSITNALGRDGYISPGNVNTWYDYADDKAVAQKFFIQNSDDIWYLKNKLWNESRLASVEWRQSEQMRKVIEAGQPYGHSRPLIREWWM